MMKKRVLVPDGEVLREIEGKDLQELLRKGMELHQAVSGREVIHVEAMMFSHAKQFHNVVGDTYPQESTPEAFSKFTAFCVNAAFALEVYLKLLRRRTLAENTKLKDHKLKKLYDSLSDETVAELENRFSDHLKVRFPDAIDPISAAETCSLFSDAFVKWRYRYEEPLKPLDVPIDNVVLLLNVLSQYCSDMLNRQR